MLIVQRLANLPTSRVPQGMLYVISGEDVIDLEEALCYVDARPIANVTTLKISHHL